MDVAGWLQSDNAEEAVSKTRELRPHAPRFEIWLKSALVATLGADGRVERH